MGSARFCLLSCLWLRLEAGRKNLLGFMASFVLIRITWSLFPSADCLMLPTAISAASRFRICSCQNISTPTLKTPRRLIWSEYSEWKRILRWELRWRKNGEHIPHWEHLLRSAIVLSRLLWISFHESGFERGFLSHPVFDGEWRNCTFFITVAIVINNRRKVE